MTALNLVPCDHGHPVYIEADTMISNKLCYLHGLLLNVATSGGDITLYNGRDATSGRKVMVVKALANVTNPIAFATPVLFESGLFVDIGSNVNSVTLFICYGCKPNWPYYPLIHL